MGFTFQCLIFATSLVAVIAYASVSERDPMSRRDAGDSHRWRVAADPGLQARNGVRAAAVVCGALLTIAAPTLYGMSDAARAAAGFLGLLLAPGAAVVLFLRIRDPLTELALSVAVSMTVLVLGSQLLLAVHLWKPVAAFQVLLVVTAPVLVWHACTALGALNLRPGSHARA